MIDSTYTTEALAWSVVWIGAGLTFRQWLASRTPRTKPHGGRQ